MDNNVSQSNIISSTQELSPFEPIKPHLDFKKICLITGMAIIILLTGTGSYILGQNSVRPAALITPTITQIAQKTCSLEAKVCPDGSSVGRSGPNCEFAPCPTVIPSVTNTKLSVDQKNRCNDASIRKLNNAQAYVYQKEDYKKIGTPEIQFEGILTKNPPLPSNMATTLMRELTYKLNGINIDTRDDLSEYINKVVIITGKVNKFQLEGRSLTEIIPVNITCK